MTKRKAMDLTSGNIYRQIILFSLPILVGEFFQNLYNSVDSIVVGQFVGKTALAAVSSSNDISMLLTGFFTGLSVGAGIIFSRYFGAGKHEDLHDAIHTALSFSFVLGVLLALAGVVLSPVLLKIVACPADVWVEANNYLKIYFIGVLFTSLYNVSAGVLRSVGDSKTPFYYLVIASIINMILDFVMVRWMNLGVIGAGIATIIAQFISFALVFKELLTTNDVHKVRLSEMRIDKDKLIEVITLGIPSAIQSSLVSISNLFVQRYTNMFGSTAMTGIGSARKIDKFVGMIGKSVGLASATFVSQNVGSKNYQRAFKGVRACLVICLTTFVLTGSLTLLFAKEFVSLFTTDVAAMQFGISMIYVMTPCFIFQALNQLYSNVTRGFGRSTTVMVLSLLGMIGCRQIFLMISMSVFPTVYNIYWCYPVGWFFSALFVYIYYYFYIKKVYKTAI